MSVRTADERRPQTLTVHEHLVRRAREAQDAVFGDASVDALTLAASLKSLGDRIVKQLDALAQTLKASVREKEGG